MLAFCLSISSLAVFYFLLRIGKLIQCKSEFMCRLDYSPKLLSLAKNQLKEQGRLSDYVLLKQVRNDKQAMFCVAQKHAARVQAVHSRVAQHRRIVLFGALCILIRLQSTFKCSYLQNK